MFDIPFKRHETFNCFDENIVSIICQCYQRESAIYFLNDFGFVREVKTGENNPFRVYTSCEMRDKLLNDFLGIELKIINKEGINYAQFCKMLQQEMEGKGLLGISMDVYQCPWNIKSFGIIHMQHYAMIIDADGEKCICIDPYFDSYRHVLPIRKLYDIVGSVVSFDIGEQYIDYDAIKEMHLVELMKCRSRRKEDIINYAQLILEQNIDVLYRNTKGDINFSGLVFAINTILEARCNYRNALDAYGKELGIDNKVNKDLALLCKKWEKVKNLCIMAIYKNKDNYLKFATEDLYNLADEEERIIDSIIYG